MHIHNVYFWLKDDQDAASRAGFERRSWSGWPMITAVESGYFGKPPTPARCGRE